MSIAKKNVSTEKIINRATQSLGFEVETMTSKSNSAINVFNTTIQELEAINADLQVSADRARHLAKIANEKADEAERKIAENSSVCQKIYEIIGKPVAA